MKLEDKIELVKNDMLKRFPECHHTIKILIWDDGTDSVECRYGDSEKIYISMFYNDELTFREEPIIGRIFIDEFGTEYNIIKAR